MLREWPSLEDSRKSWVVQLRNATHVAIYCPIEIPECKEQENYHQQCLIHSHEHLMNLNSIFITYEADAITIIILISYVGKLRHIEAKELVYGHRMT